MKKRLYCAQCLKMTGHTEGNKCDACGHRLDKGLKDAKEFEGMNWLCRIMGHKWVTVTRGHKDGAPVKWQQIWPCCVRCGCDSPESLRQAQEDYEEAEELGREWYRIRTEDVDRKVGLASPEEYIAKANRDYDAVMKQRLEDDNGKA